MFAEKKLCEEFSNIVFINSLKNHQSDVVMQTKWKYNRDLDERRVRRKVAKRLQRKVLTAAMTSWLINKNDPGNGKKNNFLQLKR